MISERGVEGTQNYREVDNFILSQPLRTALFGAFLNFRRKARASRTFVLSGMTHDFSLLLKYAKLSFALSFYCGIIF